MRVRLRAGLRVLWRDSYTVQVGWGSRPSVIVANPTQEELALLRALQSNGVAHDRSVSLLARLHDGDLLIAKTSSPLVHIDHSLRSRLASDAFMWAITDGSTEGWSRVIGRQDRAVAVRGLGRTGAQIVRLLAHCGVGRLIIWDPATVLGNDISPGGFAPQHVNFRRDHALRELVLAECPNASVTVAPEARADLVVLIGHYMIDPREFDDLVRNDVPHLAITMDDSSVVVGPLVRPGSTPCLRCVELHRSDIEPAWPMLSTQLLGLSPDELHAEETTLSSSAASIAVPQILAALDGMGGAVGVDSGASNDGGDSAGADSAGAEKPRMVLVPIPTAETVEFSLDDPLPGTRTWSSHPDCGCIIWR